MGDAIYLILLALASVLHVGYGCQMEGVGNWLLTQDAEVLDTYRGIILSRATTNIANVTGITVGGSVNYAPYLNIELSEDGGSFTISTSDGYEQYEENETSEFISFAVTFRCSDASTNSLIFSIRVVDTNNNPPTFRPTNDYEFTITPPLPPGFQITGIFGNDIIVRDIDLTTSRIDFSIEDNPYFEIAYEGRSTTDQKEFLASLRTTVLIRNLPEDLQLTVSATDVDATGDPPITTTATITVRADDTFLFPDEPVFAQPFYMATYTNNQVVLEQIISLRQGYDDEVIFSLEGEYSDYFGIVTNENQVSIGVTTALPTEILRTGRIILVVRAERDNTSGGSATVIIELPEVLGLEFEQAQYTGQIVDNVLQTLQLSLVQGYEEGFNVTLQNEYASYFSTSVQGNVITLSMTPLDAQIVDENNFIALQVTASNDFSSAFTVVTLDIIKEDNVTPVFEKAIYLGEYDPGTGLSIEQITLEQGYDDTVSFSLEGEYSEHFSITNEGQFVTLTSSGIPSEVWTEQVLLLTIRAAKPRTVTATTTVSITLPSERQLSFEAPTYSGTLQEDTLTLSTIVLDVGYAEDVYFVLAGDYANYFTLSPVGNEVTVNLSTALPDDVILGSNFLTLTLTAAGLHAVPTSTTILIEIIKQDLSTPVFTENIYRGTYSTDNLIEIGNISLSQGYDPVVTFRLAGEHSQYFQITSDANNVNLALSSEVPPEVIFREKVLLFSILAEKPLTVGAHAVISIAFPEELTDSIVMRFSRNTYVGSLENNALILENIILETGYEINTEFSLSGEYSSYFLLQNTNNGTSITLQDSLPEEVIDENTSIILEVEASRERAVSVASTVVIDIVKEDVVPLVFSSAYYRSVYADGSLEELTITLSEGYEDTVSFELQGESSVWFTITNVGNNVYLTRNSSIEIPEDVLENNDYFLFTIVANKPDSTGARAAIFIHLPKQTPETVILRFSQTSYVGRIENGELYAPTITLLGEREPISLNITGEYAQYFEVVQISGNDVLIRLREDSLPENISEIPFVIIDIEAQYPEAFSGYTTVVLEVIKQPEIITPVFEQPYYVGEYSEQEGLQFEQSIRLIQGFDESVVFTLAGDDAEWFELTSTVQNNLTLVINNNGLDQITNRSYLLLSVVASKSGSIPGEAAVIINLSDLLGTKRLSFAQNFYVGSIQNNTLNITDIILQEGNLSDLNITLTGDHVEYFQLTNQEGTFILQLLSELPENIINDNSLLVFSLEVNHDDTQAHTTIVLELISTEVTPFAFENAYYEGSYSIIDGFTFESQIFLIDGYDETVSFSLEGDDSQWFGIIDSEYPLVLIQTDLLPNEVVSNNQQLIFVVLAEKPGNFAARSTIIVSIIDDTTVLDFERNVYIGTIESNATTNIDTVVLTEGYSQDVSFSLFGDFESYFSLIQNESSITISLQTNIPEELIPGNGIILLELQASAPLAISAYTTLIFGIIQKELESLQFTQIYYAGRYSESEGLYFQNNITLAEGYDDENVQFVLEGDDSQYFQANVINNLVSLSLIAPIPTEIMLNYRHLIFTILAESLDAISTRATIVVTLINESEITVLRFDQTSYLGSIDNNTINLDLISLTDGYSENVTYNLRGDLASYFSLASENTMVTISLQTIIPDDLIPNNGLVLLELQALAPNAISAFATIVLDFVKEEIVVERLTFSNSYYIGEYSEAGGLIFNASVYLIEGYDDTVQFVLEGEDSQYFGLDVTGNSISINTFNPIPTEVVANNQHLIFTIRADRPEATTVRATIIISLINDYIENMTILGFDRITYVGSVENENVILQPITLEEGYSEAVTFRIRGDLESYFALTSDEALVAVTLQTTIPEQLIPENQIIILELEASAPQSVTAKASIVLQVVHEQNVILEQLAFSEAYYTGHYTETDGLVFNDLIILSQGYGENTTFVLEGDSSQYFEALVTANSVSLRVTTPIPSAVVMNNQQLIFTVRAEKPEATTVRATVVISLLDEFNEDLNLLGFDRITYTGSLDNGTLALQPITLIEGYSESVSFRLLGDLASYFTLTTDERLVTLTIANPVAELLLNNSIIMLEIEATAPNAISAHAAIVLEIISDEINDAVEQLVLSATYYTGHYTEIDGLTFEDTITLTEGYDESVTFALEGDSSQYFEMVVLGNSVSLRLRTPIPSAVVMNNHQLIFIIRAEKPEAIIAQATIVISLLDEYNEDMILLSFDRITYVGSIVNNTINLEEISLSEGYSEEVVFRLLGDLSSYFSLSSEDSKVTISLNSRIPEELVPENRIILLEIEASAPNTISAKAVIVINIVQEDTSLLEQLIFSELYYSGVYTEFEGLLFEENITLAQAYNETVTFSLYGDSSQYFEVVDVAANAVSLRLITPIPSAIVISNHQLIFTIRAEKPNAITATATIVISLIDDYNDATPVLGFNRISFIGSINNDIVNLDAISLIEGSPDSVQFTLLGDLQNYFTVTTNETTITITLTSPIPEEQVPSNRIIVLEIQASSPDAISAHATIVLEVFDVDLTDISFSEPFYTGLYTRDDGLILDTPISLSEGFDENVQFNLEGDDSQWFQIAVSGNILSLTVHNTIPDTVLESNRKLIFIISAQNSRSFTKTTIIISLNNEASRCDTWFEKVLYEGILQGGVVNHETISVTGYNGTNIQIIGAYAELFSALVVNGEVTMQWVGSVSLPADVFYVALELQAGTDGAVLLLDILQTETTEPPTVTFGSPSYILRAEVSQTGLLGQVQATADNGEAVSYALAVDNAHLLQRIFVGEEGELYLSAPANVGVYSFQVIATTVFTRTSGTAEVYLTVEAVTIWDDNYILPPLQILDRDEESAYESLVPFNSTAFEGCRFILNNRWPIDQTWLYVDENGLHAREIDREHASIAFMALSQIQVELILECDSDSTRSKRTLNSRLNATQLEHLGPYDYGDGKWILTDSINNNPRRSFVNLIVNDINDNYPIFIGKQDEPIVVAYPVADLEERVLPRALAEVKATDADIGENAALVYWSADEALAVSPTTGSVHVRDISRLQDNDTLTVFATDRNGQGLTGSLSLLIKLVDRRHIAVVTVRYAFLVNENQILNNFTNAFGYEVKALRSSVISDSYSEGRRKREAILSTGASLQLYVYGLIEREPVDVEQLTRDINTFEIETLIIASTISLQDHLESLEICILSGRDTGLFVSTIVLAVLLFILIVAAAVWFFLKWRKSRNYEEFSDANSLASRNDSQLASTIPKADLPKPRINIEDLKKSEKRLQDMLDASSSAPGPQAEPQKVDKPTESKVNIPDLPLVIQSIDKLKAGDVSDDEDEFGERKKITPRRKSVVTFNENVEKIIHVEDPPDDSDLEIFRL